MKRLIARNSMLLMCLLLPQLIWAQDLSVLPPVSALATHYEPAAGPGCGERPFGFLWTGFDATHEYDVYGHRRMAVRTAPRAGIQVEGLLNRPHRGCLNCPTTDPCNCNTGCSTSLLDAVSRMRRNNCAGCGPRCNCPVCTGSGFHGGGHNDKAHGALPADDNHVAPTPAVKQQFDSSAPVPPKPPAAPFESTVLPKSSDPTPIVRADPEQGTTAPSPESNTQPHDAHLDNPPVPNNDVLQFPPTPDNPKNLVPQNTLPTTKRIRSSRRSKRDRTLSAIGRYIRT